MNQSAEQSRGHVVLVFGATDCERWDAPPKAVAWVRERLRAIGPDVLVVTDDLGAGEWAIDYLDGTGSLVVSHAADGVLLVGKADAGSLVFDEAGRWERGPHKSSRRHRSTMSARRVEALLEMAARPGHAAHVTVLIVRVDGSQDELSDVLADRARALGLEVEDPLFDFIPEGDDPRPDPLEPAEVWCEEAGGWIS